MDFIGALQSKSRPTFKRKHRDGILRNKEIEKFVFGRYGKWFIKGTEANHSELVRGPFRSRYLLCTICPKVIVFNSCQNVHPLHPLIWAQFKYPSETALKKKMKLRLRFTPKNTSRPLSAPNASNTKRSYKKNTSRSLSTPNAPNASNASNTNDTAMAETEQAREISTLCKHGYERVHKICDSLQGEVWKAQVMNPLNKAIDVSSYVVIKSCDKKLFKKQIAIECDFSFCVDENIVKEARILKYLTHSHKSLGHYVTRYIDFFQSESHYYLVTKHANGTNLKQFIQKWHYFMRHGELTFSEYNKAIKFIMFQLASVMQWLHKAFYCAHLGLNCENIMIINGEFISHEGTLKVNNNLSIRLGGFGVAEMFANASFVCYKHNLSINNGRYVAPQVYNNDTYDASAADVWSMGMIFYYCVVGEPFDGIHDLWQEIDSEYRQIRQLVQYLSMHNLLKYFGVFSFELLKGLLTIDEKQRIDISDVVQHQWFRSYYSKYKRYINHKIMTDTKKHKDCMNFS